MPTTCLVFGCGSRSNRDQVRFFVVPNVMHSIYFPHLTDLSRKRRQAWLNSIKRTDLTASKLRNQRVCSKHFITGKPSALEDTNHPDWAPSQNMGYISLEAEHPYDVDNQENRTKRIKIEHIEIKVEPVDTGIDLNLEET